MTPHYDKWHAEGHKLTDQDPYKIENAHKIVPAGWHNPVPIPYLVAEEISLAIRVLPHPSLSEADWNAVKEKLSKGIKEAFDAIGAGAKTAVGYGYFELDENAESQLNQSSYERKLLQALEERECKPADMIFKAIELLEENYFENDALNIAKEIKKWMIDTDQAINRWTTNSGGTTKQKKAHKRTLRVLAFLEGETE